MAVTETEAAPKQRERWTNQWLELKAEVIDTGCAPAVRAV